MTDTHMPVFTCQWCGTDHTRKSLWESDCGLSSPCQTARLRDAAPKPRERWKLAGREGGTIYGPPYYVYHLHNADGSVNSCWLVPVSQLLGGKL
jgi:hypothetical protein